MSKLFATFQERFGDWLAALGQHLQLSLPDLAPCDFSGNSISYLFGTSQESCSNWVLQLAGIFQTIPSMALLGLFIPIMGIERFLP